MKYHLNDLTDDMWFYFNWAANAVLPFFANGADIYLDEHKEVICEVAQTLLEQIDYVPGTIYRGVLLKSPVTELTPNKRLKYVSFSTDRGVAEHFADYNGFGSGIMDIKSKLGEHGYVIEYTPKPEEVLFHYHLLQVLPFAEAYSRIGLDGPVEVLALSEQKEVMILQPNEPFTNIKPYVHHGVSHPRTN